MPSVGKGLLPMSAQKDSQHKKTLENSCDRPNQSSCYAIKHDGQFSLFLGIILTFWPILAVFKYKGHRRTCWSQCYTTCVCFCGIKVFNMTPATYPNAKHVWVLKDFQKNGVMTLLLFLYICSLHVFYCHTCMCYTCIGLCCICTSVTKLLFIWH